MIMTDTLFDNTIDRSLAESLLKRLDSKYVPAFERLTEEEQLKVALYFLPHTSEKTTLPVTRPRVVKWYCPFADQKFFPFWCALLYQRLYWLRILRIATSRANAGNLPLPCCLIFASRGSMDRSWRVIGLNSSSGWWISRTKSACR